MKVLVVDDDWALADVISITLRRAGYEPIIAHDGQQALEYWDADSPSLVILDLNLPKINGFEVLKQIRSKASTPILILSVRDDQDDIDFCLQSGANGYFIKPFSPRQLLNRAKAILQQNTNINQLKPERYLINRNPIITKPE